MANKKHTIITLLVSALIVAGMVVYVENRDTSNSPSLLLEEGQSEHEPLMDGPLTPVEQEITNPEITNTMNPTAIITTNKGVIELELFESEMPITVGNFVSLAESGFYTDVKFRWYLWVLVNHLKQNYPYLHQWIPPKLLVETVNG